MDIVELGLAESDIIADLHLRAEFQTHVLSDPQYLVNNSNKEGRRNLWKISLSTGSSRIYAAYVEALIDPIGFICGRLVDDARYVWLSSIYVLQDFQFQGAGKLLLRAYAEAALTLGLREMRGVVPVKCHSARDFFASSGFEEGEITHICGSRGPVQNVDIICKDISLLHRF